MHNAQGNCAIKQAVPQHRLLLKSNANKGEKGQEEGREVDVVGAGRRAHRLRHVNGNGAKRPEGKHHQLTSSITFSTSR